MNRKIWKALGIAVCMLALAAPRAMAARYEVGMGDPFIKFGDAVEAINQSGDTENEIVLMENITLGGNYINYTLTNDKTTTTKTTTIKGEGHTISIKSKAEIKVEGEKTVLNLGANGYDKKLTIDGDTTAAFIVVSGGATANMNENVTLQNRMFTGNAYVLVTGSKSVFNMKGGVIEGGSRAVIAQSGATFYMRSGEIKNCKVNGDGVISVTDNSKFIMEGGIISGCKADTGGGLYADNSAVTINKGTISECSADKGGGLYAKNSSTVTISGGTISGCKVGAGGGLFVDSSTIRISGGIISECTTSDTGNGGGLYAKNSTIKITGGRIENNKAAHGGGVALIGDTTFEDSITNWTVISNEAYATGGVGGGIKLENGSMDVSAGSNRIYNNTAGGQGADIFLLGSSTIRLPNAANMGAKYLDSGIYIDGWYKDDNPRYTPSENGEVVGAGVELKGGLSLVASYKADPVRIEIDANGGVGGSGSQTVQKGTNVTLEAPTKEGHLFKGWKDEKGNSYPAGEDGKVKITVTSDMTLTAEWKKLPSAENLPKTGDESPVLLWGAALAVSAAACFMLRRRK